MVDEDGNIKKHLRPLTEEEVRQLSHGVSCCGIVTQTLTGACPLVCPLNERANKWPALSRPLEGLLTHRTLMQCSLQAQAAFKEMHDGPGPHHPLIDHVMGDDNDVDELWEFGFCEKVPKAK